MSKQKFSWNRVANANGFVSNGFVSFRIKKFTGFQVWRKHRTLNDILTTFLVYEADDFPNHSVGKIGFTNRIHPLCGFLSDDQSNVKA